MIRFWWSIFFKKLILFGQFCIIVNMPNVSMFCYDLTEEGQNEANENYLLHS
jgi:hypothetical protein